jgi:hypothetical protein
MIERIAVYFLHGTSFIGLTAVGYILFKMYQFAVTGVAEL